MVYRQEPSNNFMNIQYIPQNLCVDREEFDRRCETTSSPFIDNKLRNYAPESEEQYESTASTDVESQDRTPIMRKTTKIYKKLQNFGRNFAKQWRKERKAFYQRLKDLRKFSSKFKN